MKTIELQPKESLPQQSRRSWLIRGAGVLAAGICLVAFNGDNDTPTQSLAPAVVMDGTVVDSIGLDGADASAVAERQPRVVDTIDGFDTIDIPLPDLAGPIRDTYSFIDQLACTATAVRDSSGERLGVFSDSHCVKSSSTGLTVYEGDTFMSGPSEKTGPVLFESNPDNDVSRGIVYAGMDGHSAEEVRAQIIKNDEEIDWFRLENGDQAVIVSFAKTRRTQDETNAKAINVARLVDAKGFWFNRPSDKFPIFVLNYRPNERSVLVNACGYRGSGGGTWAYNRAGILVPIGANNDHAEYKVVNMPYPPAYGEELRQVFAGQFGLSSPEKLKADGACMIATPVLPNR